MGEQAEQSGDAAAKRAENAYCPQCGYQLKGLEQRGVCPECGAAYDPSKVLSRIPPSTLQIVGRFGWPLALYALATVLMVAPASSASDAYIWLLLLGGFALLSCFINVPVQFWLLRRWRATVAGTRGERVVSVMVLMSVLSIIGPFVVFGGCLALVM